MLKKGSLRGTLVTGKNAPRPQFISCDYMSKRLSPLILHIGGVSQPAGWSLSQFVLSTATTRNILKGSAYILLAYSKSRPKLAYVTIQAEMIKHATPN